MASIQKRNKNMLLFILMMIVKVIKNKNGNHMIPIMKLE